MNEKKWKQFLAESGLNRVRKHIEAYDSAIITAYRDNPKDDMKCSDNALVGGKNKIRNRDLKASLLSLGYGVTKVDGSYIENFQTDAAIEVKEASLFVVNLKKDSSFVKKMIKFGEKFCQDSVMIIPKGGEGAYLYGTNKSEFPGYGNKVELGSVKFGDESEFMTKVRGKPFVVGEESLLETYSKLSKNERMAVKSIHKKLWKSK